MRKSVLLLSLLFSCFIALPALAFDASDTLDIVEDVAWETYDTDQGAGTTESILGVIGRVVQIGIGVLGAVAVILFIYSGFLWMTAGGNDVQVQKAKNIIKAVIIGLVIISIAYALVTYISGQLVSDIPQRRN